MGNTGINHPSFKKKKAARDKTISSYKKKKSGGGGGSNNNSYSGGSQNNAGGIDGWTSQDAYDAAVAAGDPRTVNSNISDGSGGYSPALGLGEADYSDTVNNSPITDIASNPQVSGTDTAQYDRINELFTGLYDKNSAAEKAQLASQQAQFDEFRNQMSRYREQQMNDYTKYTDQMYAPQYSALKASQDSENDQTRFRLAAGGGLTGTRASEIGVQLENKQYEQTQAMDGQRNAQLALYQAQQQNADEATLNMLQQNLLTAQDNARASEDQYTLAREGALKEQLDRMDDKEKEKVSQMIEFYAAQGKAYNPSTGETYDDPVYAAQLKQLQAQADAAGKEIKWVDDGNGNVSAIMFDTATGKYDVIDVMTGKAVGGGGGGGGAGGSTNEFGFDGKMSDIYNDINNGGDPVEVATKYGYKGDARNLRVQAGNYKRVIDLGYSVNPLTGDISPPGEASPSKQSPYQEDYADGASTIINWFKNTLPSFHNLSESLGEAFSFDADYFTSGE